jgi:hypothetical protein
MFTAGQVEMVFSEQTPLSAMLMLSTEPFITPDFMMKVLLMNRIDPPLTVQLNWFLLILAIIQWTLLKIPPSL